ncbi:hypothetical protein [Hymenobacter coalescens]
MSSTSASTAAVPAASPPARRRFRWLWWLLGLLGLLGLAVVAARLFDPWLRRTLERQVAAKSQGRYELRIGSLRSSFAQRAVTLRRVWLRPTGWPRRQPAAGQPAPWVLLTVDEVRVAGIGLGALLRGEVVSVDTLRIRTVRARVLSTPQRPAAGKPLHEQLPTRLPGIRLNQLLIDDVRVASGLHGPARTRLRQGRLAATDVLISRGAAQDSMRLSYAATVELTVDGLEANVPGHHLRLGAARFSSRGRRLQIDSLGVQPVTDGQQPAGAARATLWLPRLALAGLNPQQLRRRILQADSLLLTAPRLALALPAQAPPPLHQALAPYLRRVLLGHVVVAGGRLRLTRTKLAPQLADLHLHGTDVRVDAAAARDPRRVLYARDWTARSGPGQLTIDAPYYRVGWQGLRLDTRARTLQLSGGLIRPTMSPDGLARSKGHQASHLTLRVPTVAVTGLDFGGLLRKAVRAQTVELRSLRLQIIGNAKYPLGSKLALVTPENVRRLPFRLDVRTLRVRDFLLAIKFTGQRARRPGYFRITRFNGTGTNLTNDPRRMTAARPAVLRVTAYLQDRCRLQVTAWLPLLDAQGRHRLEGTFGPAPFAILNSITEPTRFARFERGQVRHIRVRLQVNRQQVTGTMWARYSDLKVDMLSGKGGGPDRQTFLTKVVSKAANVLVVRNDNPRRRGEALKVGTVRSDRDLRYSVFTIWLQGVNSGLLNSVGVPRKLAEELSEL